MLSDVAARRTFFLARQERAWRGIKVYGQAVQLTNY